MDKPEDIPQDVWAWADKVLGLTFLDSPMHFVLQESIARAILKAKEDEREACERAALGPRFPEYTSSTRFEKNEYGLLNPGSPYDQGRFDAFVSIRSRSKPTQC